MAFLLCVSFLTFATALNPNAASPQDSMVAPTEHGRPEVALALSTPLADNSSSLTALLSTASTSSSTPPLTAAGIIKDAQLQEAHQAVAPAQQKTKNNDEHQPNVHDAITSKTPSLVDAERLVKDRSENEVQIRTVTKTQMTCGITETYCAGTCLDMFGSPDNSGSSSSCCCTTCSCSGSSGGSSGGGSSPTPSPTRSGSSSACQGLCQVSSTSDCYTCNGNYQCETSYLNGQLEYVCTHCSCDKSSGGGSNSGGGSDSDDDDGIGGCFSGSSVLTLESGGTKTMAELLPGDRILTADRAGGLSFSDVAFLPHGPNHGAADFVAVETAGGRRVLATPRHLLLTCAGDLEVTGTPAASLAPGVSCLKTVDGEEVVAAVTPARANGLYTAVAADAEFIVVDGLVASPFAVLHAVPNAYYNAHRAVYKLWPSLLQQPAAKWVNQAFEAVAYPAALLAVKAMAELSPAAAGGK